MGGRISRLAAPALVATLALAACDLALPDISRPPVPTPTPSPSPSPSPMPTPSPSPSPTPTPSPVPTPIIHVVVAGDTLSDIARRYKTTALSIAYWNRTTYPSLDPDSAEYRPDRIEVGWRLALFPRSVYTPSDEAAPS
jgi:hypothetical protein